MLEDEAVFSHLYRTVSAERQRKIDGFIFPKDKRLSLAAELLLKKGLYNAGIKEYTIRYGQFGKPYIEDKDIYFNLSHSEEMVMCTVSSAPVGCDVERVADIDLDIAKRFFYTSEYEMIAAAKDAVGRRDLFFRLWTLKESFMKATGLGMELALDSFRVIIDGEKINVEQFVDRNNYYFREYDLKNGYKYAVCGMKDDIADAQLVSLV